MPNHDVSVSQLKATSYSGEPGAFLNVDENQFGAIAVWGSKYNLPTFLLENEYNFYFIQFSSEKVAEEWLNEMDSEKNGWDRIKKLNVGKAFSKEIGNYPSGNLKPAEDV